MDKKPNEAMLVLDDTVKDNFNFKEYLKDDDMQDAEIIRREALFQGKIWNGYVDRINSNFDQLLEKLDDKNPASIKDILRLAIAYYMLNKQEALGELISSLGTKNEILKNTMELLAKIVRVVQKIDQSAPHHSLLVIDATTGQNAFVQTEHFKNLTLLRLWLELLHKRIDLFRNHTYFYR